MEMRDILAYFAYKYEGDSIKILEALANKEPVTPDQISSLHNSLKYNYFTVMDDNYPELLMHTENPPIVMFYKGDPGLINEDNEIIAKQSNEGVRMLHAYDVNITNKGICLNCVMACECHDDMDMLLEFAERAQENLKKALTVYQSREIKEKQQER